MNGGGHQQDSGQDERSPGNATGGAGGRSAGAWAPQAGRAQTFMGARSLLKETPRQAEDREQLRALLAGRPSGGIIFSTVQKFSPGEDE
jgi:hypothetical protein